MAVRTCGLCGHPEDFKKCGSAFANDEYLCHADDHSCYHQWTCYGERPDKPPKTLKEQLEELGRLLWQ